jgi:hypothetical protein
VENSLHHLDTFVTPPSDPIEGIAHSGPDQSLVIRGGKLIDHCHILEIKSKSSLIPKEQMWYGRTPNCCLGAQNKANKREFTRATVKHLDVDEYVAWETEVKAADLWNNAPAKDTQRCLQKLEWLLQELRRMVKEETKDGSAYMYALGRGEDELVVYEAEENVGALPKEIVEKFWPKE